MPPWSCLHCSIVNWDTRDACRACGKSAGSGPQAVGSTESIPAIEKGAPSQIDADLSLVSEALEQLKLGEAEANDDCAAAGECDAQVCDAGVSSSTVSSACFLAGTLLRAPQVGTFVAVEQLQQDDIIQSASGNQLRVAEIKHFEEVHECVEIAAGGCTLVVTDSHRVMVARGKQVQHKRAGALHKGDRVLCNGNQPMLVDVRAVSQPVSAYQIVFEPDEPVETIVIQEGTIKRASAAILTLGHGTKVMRRGGMRRRRTSTSSGNPTHAKGLLPLCLRYGMQRLSSKARSEPEEEDDDVATGDRRLERTGASEVPE